MSDTRTPPGRNDSCPCGSGRKWKRCCLARRPCVLCAAAEGRLDCSATVGGAIFDQALAGLCADCAALPDPRAALADAFRACSRTA